MHRILVFVHAAVIAMALVLGFLALFSMHQAFDTPDYGNYHVRIEQDDESVSSRDVSTAVEELARREEMSIAVPELDRSDIDGGRYYYITSFDPSTRLHTWLEDGYPNFSERPHIEARPWHGWETDDLRTAFTGMQTRQEAELVLRTLESLGLEATIGRVGESRSLTEYLFHRNTGLMVAVTVVFVIAATGAGVLLNARAYGVRRLAGHSYGRILGADLVAVARWWTVLLPAVTTCGALLLFFYNGLAQAGRLAGVTAQILLALVVLALAAHTAALGLLYRTGVIEALKGRLPTRSVAVAVYTVRLAAVLLAITMTTATVADLQRVNNHAVGAEEVARAEGAARVHIGGIADPEEVIEADRALFGPWLKEADVEGETVLAIQESPDEVLPPDQRSADTVVLFVNDTYLEHEGALDDVNAHSGTLRVFAPRSDMSLADELAAGAIGWAEFRTGDPVEHDVQVIPYSDGRTFFTYGTFDPVTMNQRPLIEDPIVVALPNGYLKAEWYAMEARSGNLVFLDQETVEEGIAEHDLSFYVTGVEPIATTIAKATHSATTQLRISAVNLVVAVAVLVMASVASCLVYARARAQHIFARHISGWTFGATHRLMLGVEVVLVAVLIGWAAMEMIATMRAFDDIANGVFIADIVNARRTLLASCAIAVTMAAMVIAVLAYFHRRIVREGASQA